MKRRHTAATLTLVLTMGYCANADAEPTALTAEPSDHAEIYAETSLGFGVRFQGTSAARSNLRAALGVAFRVVGARGRAGVVGDLFLVHRSGGRDGAAIGIEGQLDWDIASGWRLGPRLSISWERASAPRSSGLLEVVGLRLHNRTWSFGIDAFRLPGNEQRVEPSDRSDATGLLVIGGLGGRAGKYAFAAAVTFGVLAILRSLSSAH